MAHPPGFPTLSPPAHSWGGGSHKSLKTAGENCTEQASLAASAHPDGQGQEGQKARTPHPLTCERWGGGGLRDHSIPTPGHGQKAIIAKATGWHVSNGPSPSESGERAKEPLSGHHALPSLCPCPGELHLFLSAQPDPYRSKLPNPGDGRGDTPATTVFFPLA